MRNNKFEYILQMFTGKNFFKKVKILFTAVYTSCSKLNYTFPGVLQKIQQSYHSWEIF